MTPAGRVRLFHQAVETARQEQTDGERALRKAEKVVYRSSRTAASPTTFGPVGRAVLTVLGLLPALGIGLHAFLNRTETIAVLEVVLGFVPAVVLAVLVLRDAWKPAPKAERVLVAERLED
jgi:hypothetical protein